MEVDAAVSLGIGCAMDNKFHRLHSDQTLVAKERKKAQLVKARASQRTPARSKAGVAARNEIAEYLARVPPKNY